MTAPTRPGRLAVGLVRGVRGLRGQVRIELLTDRPEDRFTVGATLYPEGTESPLTIDEASPVADGLGWWLQFREVRDRDAADLLRGVYLEIDAPDEPREAGRWFWHELEGIAVRSTAGDDLGNVVDIYRAGAAEVFVVRGPRGELDVPGVRGIVVDLAPERGEMIVDLDALALDARPVEDEGYVRPRDRRPRRQPKPRGPRQPAPGTSAPRIGSSHADASGRGAPPAGTPGREPPAPAPDEPSRSAPKASSRRAPKASGRPDPDTAEG